MRVLKQNSPDDPLNQGTVVFHAGANIARRWEDFQEYSEADQQFFDQLLPVEELDFQDASEIVVSPSPREGNNVEVRGQTDVSIEEIPLLEDDAAMKAIETLRTRGYSADDVRRAMEHQPVPTTKVNERQAARAALDTRVKTEAGRILGERNLNHQGYDLDSRRLRKTNFVVVKASIDKHVAKVVGRGSGERHELTRQELDTINARFDEIVASALEEVFDA